MTVGTASLSGVPLSLSSRNKILSLDIPLLIPRAFGALGHERVCMERRLKSYEETELDDRHAHDLIVRSLIDEKIFPPSKLGEVVNEWRNPRHEEFEPRTVWSLSNAYTEVAKVPEDKPAALNTLSKRTRDLYGFFDRSLGLVFQTQEESVRGLANEVSDDAVAHNDALYHREN